jgi:hypothetical protein
MNEAFETPFRTSNETHIFGAGESSQFAAIVHDFQGPGSCKGRV